jgi:hypothetical protein
MEKQPPHSDTTWSQEGQGAMNIPYFDMTCEECCVHFLALCKEEEILSSALSFASAAVQGSLTPIEAIRGYFDGYHTAGHPPEPQNVSETRRMSQLYGDDEENTLLKVSVETVFRNGVRMEPHPFDLFQGNDLGAFCGHGIENGDFCSLAASDLIHSFRCPVCRQRGWIWTDDGQPHCGYCNVGGASCE